MAKKESSDLDSVPSEQVHSSQVPSLRETITNVEEGKENSDTVVLQYSFRLREDQQSQT
jgi:hypothetical protein